MLLELTQAEAEAMLVGVGHPYHETAVAKLEQAIAVEKGQGGEFRAGNFWDGPEQMNGGGAF